MFYVAQSSTNALPVDGRAQISEVKRQDEISLKLLPPNLPHDHNHHHHHQPSSPSKVPVTSSTRVPVTTKKPQVEIIRHEYESLPDDGYRFLYDSLSIK